MFQHLLVPADGSELSSMAIHKAIEFARETGAKITFFFVQPDYPIAFYGEGALIDPATPDKFTGVPCTTRTTVSDLIFMAIIDAATDSGCDLIFMASHGRRGISGLLLGSETQKVLTHSKVPVLVWR